MSEGPSVRFDWARQMFVTQGMVGVYEDTMSDEVRRASYAVAPSMVVITKGARNVFFLPAEFVEKHGLEATDL